MKKLLISFVCAFFFLSPTFANSLDQDAATKWAEILNKIEIDFDKEEYENHVYEVLMSYTQDFSLEESRLFLKKMEQDSTALLSETNKKAYYERGNISELDAIKLRVVKLEVIFLYSAIVSYEKELEQLFYDIQWDKIMY